MRFSHRLPPIPHVVFRMACLCVFQLVHVNHLSLSRCCCELPNRWPFALSQPVILQPVVRRGPSSSVGSIGTSPGGLRGFDPPFSGWLEKPLSFLDPHPSPLLESSFYPGLLTVNVIYRLPGNSLVCVLAFFFFLPLRARFFLSRWAP